MTFSKKVILFLILSIFTSTFAAQKPMSIYAQAGAELTASKGDFNDRTITVKDEDGSEGTLHPATLKFLGSPFFTLGVNIKELSADVSFEYWTSGQNMTGYPDQEIERDTRIMRLGFNLIYNIYWPEFFQAGLGLGVAYTSIKSENNLFYGSKTYDVNFDGIAGVLIANLHYYVTDNIAMVPTFKFYETCFFKASSSKNNDELTDSNLWQTFVLVSVAIQYQF